MKGLRVGLGYDCHRFQDGKSLLLGGVSIPFPKGLEGHSDADALIHAVIDALLGGVCAGDIGGLFPDTDEAFRDIPSRVMLERAMEEVRDRGYRVGNVDVVVIAEEPRIAPHVKAMRENLSSLLGVEPDGISIKGKTNEAMGPFGRGEGIAAHAVVLLLPV